MENSKLQNQFNVAILNKQRLRRGAFMVVAFFSLIGTMAFVAFSVDMGMISLTRTQMRNSVDAASLAAAQEITAVLEDSADDVDGQGDVAGQVSDVNAISIEAARQKAADVAALNGVYIDPERDVEFGKRLYNGDGAIPAYSIEWGVPPYNVVKVTARRDNDDLEAPDGKLQLLFAPVMKLLTTDGSGNDTASIVVSSTAFVEARDIVLVMDYSGSMNDDSAYRSINKLSQTSIEDNMHDIYTALGPPDMGSMDFTPEYMTLTKATDAGDVHVTFKYKSVEIDGEPNITTVVLGFSNGHTQEFNGLTGHGGTFAGTGNNNNKTIDMVWLPIELPGQQETEDVTVEGSDPIGNKKPKIYVTFHGDRKSIYVESSKDLSNVVLEFEDGAHYKFDGLSGHTGTFQGTGQHAGKIIVGCWIKSGRNRSGDGPGYGERFESAVEVQTATIDIQFEDTTENVKQAFGLNSVQWPWPSGSWNSFIAHCRTNNDIYAAGYRRMYGGACLVDYLLDYKAHYHQCPDLWKTPHYPFHAAKNGASLFFEFLDGLGFGDHVGLVTYATYSKIQTGLHDEYTPTQVDLGDELITDNYDALDTIQRHKQASHFASTTGMGYGISDAIDLLGSHGREGARPTILLMTDGLANQSPDDWSLPNDWNWHEMTDYDGDGIADYDTSNVHKQYAFYQAKRAIDEGYTIHTLSVGLGADRDLMKAIAFAGSGEWIDVPGGSTVAAMEEQMLAAFSKIAANVPPAKLLNDAED